MDGFHLLCMPRSGSNYLKRLFELNSRVVLKQNQAFWKHTTNNLEVQSAIALGSAVVIPIKRPRPWLASAYAYATSRAPAHELCVEPTTLSVEEWSRQTFTLHGRASQKHESVSFESPLHYYLILRTWYRQLTAMYPHRVYLLNHEESVDNPRKALRALGVPVPDKIVRVQRRCMPSDDEVILIGKYEGERGIAPEVHAAVDQFERDWGSDVFA